MSTHTTSYTSTHAQASMGKPNQLEAWLAEEAVIRARMDAGVGVGTATAEDVRGLTGLELMQAMLRGELPYPAIAKTLDFMLIHAEYGLAIFQGTPGFAHLNPMGNIHGGWYATILDSALGSAVQTAMPVGRSYTTAELGVNYVRAIGNKAPRVRAEASVLHVGRQLATAQAKLYGPDGTLYAHATTTCLVFERKDE